jgi:hypothetical protein
MTQQEIPLTNNDARTSDWIGQTKGRVIYAYDLATLASDAEVKIDPTNEDFEQALQRVGQRGSPSTGTSEVSG